MFVVVVAALVDGRITFLRILLEHMQKLARVVTPDHDDLRIPKMYHYEAPWPAAQNEIYMINAYKVKYYIARQIVS